jgi:hypothetical protein
VISLREFPRFLSVGLRGCGPKPLLHLFMADETRLLKHLPASRKNDEVRDPAHIEARS